MLCNNTLETSKNLFFKCNYANTIWRQISTMINIPFVDSWQDLLHWMGKRVRRKYLLSILIKLSWNATIYNIWMERNKRVHLQLFRSESTILHEIQFEVRARMLEFARPRCSSLPMAIAIQWGLETVVTN
ncbi:hypothetical protein SLEP1_g54040 [Rubroshorea leprosula]|uniref:Reverse transcriptase zinc-binding domain-containing protein n=1 Tax=Rubroshorea leprosula TaxID=152421 RepID=A0AAV5MC42_9ROSI|nr:hypothetical protein SLEP1_g54040 [Rubroshorea leprosula]